jgi:NAD(P)-dependent dehydrogenase (short-subunit alcohol dehydrogenase family)
MTNTTKVALVTGANKGIGYETAHLLGDQGHTVLLGCRNAQRAASAERHLRDRGIDAHAMHLDVTDPSSLEQAAQHVSDHYGHLDVLINNAGIAWTDAPQEDTPTALRRLLDTNVIGAVAVIEAMLPLLRKAPAPRIINVSSELGSIACTLDPESPTWQIPAGIAYPTSKAALNMVTASYAKQLWDTPIKVYAANPGYCATDLNGNTGFRTPKQGAAVVAHLVALPDDGRSGMFWGHLWTTTGGDNNGILPW